MIWRCPSRHSRRRKSVIALAHEPSARLGCREDVQSLTHGTTGQGIEVTASANPENTLSVIGKLAWISELSGRTRLTWKEAGMSTDHKQSVRVPYTSNKLDTKPLKIVPGREAVEYFNIAIIARSDINMEYPRRFL